MRQGFRLVTLKFAELVFIPMPWLSPGWRRGIGLAQLGLGRGARGYKCAPAKN